MIYKVYVYYPDDKLSYSEFLDDDVDALGEYLDFVAHDKTITHIDVYRRSTIEEPNWYTMTRSM